MFLILVTFFFISIISIQFAITGYLWLQRTGVKISLKFHEFQYFVDYGQKKNPKFYNIQLAGHTAIACPERGRR